MFTHYNFIFSINSLLNFYIFLYLLLSLAVFSFWLTPGGFAWSLSKSAISGPSALHVLGLVFKIKFFGKSYDFEEDDELENMVREGYGLLGKFNWSDCFPFLGCFDLQGVRRRCIGLVGKVNVFVGKIIQEHRIKRDSAIVAVADQNCADFIDVLFDLEKENRLSDIVAVLREIMIFRGRDAVALLLELELELELEWIPARMSLHPDIQLKSQSDIHKPTDFVFNLPNLLYRLAITNETLQPHHPGPLSSARLEIRNTSVGTHFVPAGTTAMWAITHSGVVWPEPEKYRAERFTEVEAELNILGRDMRLGEFGGGRRVCRGKADLGIANVQLWLAQFLQNLTCLPVPSTTFDLSNSIFGTQTPVALQTSY